MNLLIAILILILIIVSILRLRVSLRLERQGKEILGELTITKELLDKTSDKDDWWKNGPPIEYEE